MKPNLFYSSLRVLRPTFSLQLFPSTASTLPAKNQRFALQLFYKRDDDLDEGKRRLPKWANIVIWLVACTVGPFIVFIAGWMVLMLWRDARKRVYARFPWLIPFMDKLSCRGRRQTDERESPARQDQSENSKEFATEEDVPAPPFPFPEPAIRASSAA